MFLLRPYGIRWVLTQTFIKKTERMILKHKSKMLIFKGLMIFLQVW